MESKVKKGLATKGGLRSGAEAASAVHSLSSEEAMENDRPNRTGLEKRQDLANCIFRRQPS